MGDLFFRILEDPKNWNQWQISDRYPKFWRDSLTTSQVWKDCKRRGLAHHSLGLVSENLQKVPFGKKSSFLSVKSKGRPSIQSSVVDGKLVYNYSEYQQRPTQSLVPLEVVFRFGAPEGSSFLERVSTIPQYAQSFGFTETPKAGEWFPFPVVEFFTKLEPTDRFLTREEAKEIASLSQDELDDLTAFTLILALRLKDIFSNLGLELWDGKFEFSFTPFETAGVAQAATQAGYLRRGFELVDSIGPDELRLMAPGNVHFSKEFLRRVYRNSPWYDAMIQAKKLAKERGVKDWKKICREELKQTPSPLSDRALRMAESLYPTLAQELGKTFFQMDLYPQYPSLTELCTQMRDFQ